MSKKLQARQRRSRKLRASVSRLGVPRLVVNKTNQHVYAQVIIAEGKGNKVAASASTLDKELRDKLSGSKKVRANAIGKKVAELAQKAGIKRITFDRSGFKYHGCVAELAKGAREAGLEF